MAGQSENEPSKPSAVDRILGLFSDVRAGESGSVLLMLLNVLLLLCGYYVLKTVREPLVQATGGAEMKSYATAAQAVLLMGFIPFYSWFAGRVDRRKLIMGLVIFFILNLELFYVGSLFQVPYLGFVFYVWLGIFSLAIIAQFWSLANDLYPEDVGKRLFPVIMIGATAGGLLGPIAVIRLSEAGISPYSMMQTMVGVLVVHLVLSLVAEKRGTRISVSSPADPSPDDSLTKREEGSSLAGPNGFALVLRSPYIRLIALVMVLLNLVNTTGEYLLGKAVEQSANTLVVETAFEAADQAAGQIIHKPARKAALRAANEAALKADDEASVKASAEAVVEAIHMAQPFDNHKFDETFKEAFTRGFVGKAWKAFILDFYAHFYLYVNIATFLIQAFLVSRIVKYLGIRRTVFILPFVALGAYGFIALGAGFALISLLKKAENSTDYSVMNTVRALIWLPTSREEKYKAKQAVDTFLVRTGDLLSGGFVFVGITLFHFGIKHFAWANLLLVALWACITYLLSREYRRISTTEGVISANAS